MVTVMVGIRLMSGWWVVIIVTLS